MNNYMYRFIVVMALLFSLSGCYNKPVRHLTSDIALLKVGVSTEEDVIVFLGEPDAQKVLEDGSVSWLYLDKDQSTLRKTPLIGKKMGSTVFHRALVTIKDGIVTKAEYSASDEDDVGWMDDYFLEEKKK